MRLALLAFVLWLVSCVTPYQNSFTEMKVGENLYRVTASGNGHTDQRTVESYAFRRAGEVCRHQGFTDFELKSEDRGTQNIQLAGSVNCSTIGGITNCNSRPGANINKHNHTIIFSCYNEDVAH